MGVIEPKTGEASMSKQEKIRRQIRQIRSLIQAGKQRIAVLRPVWGAYLAGETMKSLDGIVDELEREIGLVSPPPEEEPRIPKTG